QTTLVQHIEEVGITPGIELVGSLKLHAPACEQVCQYAVRDGGAQLCLNVVANQRNALASKALCPFRVTCNEHGNAVHKSHARAQGTLGIEACGLFRSHRQIVEHDFGATVLQDFHHGVHVRFAL